MRKNEGHEVGIVSSNGATMQRMCKRVTTARQRQFGEILCCLELESIVFLFDRVASRRLEVRVSSENSRCH